MPRHYGYRGRRHYYNNHEDSDSDTTRVIPGDVDFAELIRNMRGMLGLQIEETEPFPLLDLPDEMIHLILTFLPMQYRMRMRLNQRLEKIIEAGKFRDKGFIIQQGVSGMFSKLRKFRSDGFEAMFFRYRDQQYNLPRIDEVYRVLNSATFGEVRVMLPSSPLHTPVYDAVRDVCKTDILTIGTQDIRCSSDDDSNLLRLVKDKKEVRLITEGSPHLITLESLNMLHQALLHQSLRLQSLMMVTPQKVVLQYLLQLLQTQKDKGCPRTALMAVQMKMVMSSALYRPFVRGENSSSKVMEMFDHRLKLSIGRNVVVFKVFDDDAKLAAEKEQSKGAVIID